ncbi:MAG: prolyl oligopeptidase family serine peptidase [Actinomycetota bacterium]|nr:prolyl oligopeptidase family serine peptidase [Actinomycetota bacterium]
MASASVETFPRQYARTRRFACGAPRDVRVSNDGARVLFLRSSAGDDPVHALWCLDVAAGTEQVVADPRDPALAPADGPAVAVPPEELARRERVRESGSGIVAYDASADLSRACFVLDGRVYLAEVVDPERASPEWARVVELPSTGDAFDPRLSPDGASVAYVSGSTLRITGAGGDRRVIGGTARSSQDAASRSDVSWGSAEFIAAEEMGRSRGHWWSPDGRRLLVTRVDVAPVDEWWISSPVDPSMPPRAVRYPAAGTTNAEVGLFLVDPSATDPEAMTVIVDWRRDDGFEYLAHVAWAEPSTGLSPTGTRGGHAVSLRPLLAVQSRDQRTLVVLEVDPADGSAIEVHRITDPDWVDLVPGTPLRWTAADGETALATVEAHGGTNRLCRDGVPVSPTGFQIRSVIGPDGDGNLMVRASDDPLTVDVVRVAPDGSVTPVTSGNGVHGAVEGGGVMAVASTSLDGSAIRVLPAGHVLDDRSEEPLVCASPEFHVVGDRELRAAVLVSADHDGSPLPVLLDPYGGPHAQRVQRARGQYLTSQWFADRGFAVVVVDGRGTPGRGPDWDRAVKGDLAGPVLDDQVDALHALAVVDPRLDLSRVAVRGWSFGGYLAALAVLRRPDVFHAAVAGAPVTDWRLYDTHYTERYLGSPDDEAGAYLRSGLCDPSGWTYQDDTGHLHRPLLLIHGLADDNVAAAHTLALSRALLEAGRPHRVLPLSGVTHMTPQEVVAENLLHLQLDFLAEALCLELAPE